MEAQPLPWPMKNVMEKNQTQHWTLSQEEENFSNVQGKVCTLFTRQ